MPRGFNQLHIKSRMIKKYHEADIEFCILSAAKVIGGETESDAQEFAISTVASIFSAMLIIRPVDFISHKEQKAHTNRCRQNNVTSRRR